MKYTWQEISACNWDLPSSNFWSGIKVWIQRPHILNKRLIGVEVVKSVQISNRDYTSNDLVTVLLQRDSHMKNVVDFGGLLHPFGPVTVLDPFPENCSDLIQSVQLRRLLPKQQQLDDCIEVVVIDQCEGAVWFIPLSPTSNISPPFPYKIVCQENRVTLSVADLESRTILQGNQRSVDWLKSQVFPKILSWSKSVPQTNVVPSLSKVSMQVYCKNYSSLKLKYGRKLVENWPEKTDPAKFVYEDIAIAAYLMTVWEEERKLLGQERKQSFVDLGCGNGLLVHLLASEGYPGIGVDIRKRRIWDFYGTETNLIEKEIIPSASGLFPNYDWIIGNHSDELTPWIPVIASRSSYTMRVFLLPCCAYTFDGKYDRGNSSSSKYQSYLDFIEELCVSMGFNTLRDKLRIPSTKRICIICMTRNYKQEAEEELDQLRTEYIKAHSKQCSESSIPLSRVKSHGLDVEHSKEISDDNTWSSGFKPRDKVEPVRNCCALDPKLIENTITKVMKILLACEEKYVELDNEKGKCMWKCGGVMSLGALADKLGHETLVALKSQCGGLQTLLRNHKNVFAVEKGCVLLNIPTRKSPEDKKPRKRKCNSVKSFSGKPCMFFFHHPDGCPLTTGCRFSHDRI